MILGQLLLLPDPLPQPQGEQSEPLDLSMNHCSTKTAPPPFLMPNCRFHHCKPLDLRVWQNKNTCTHEVRQKNFKSKRISKKTVKKRISTYKPGNHQSSIEKHNYQNVLENSEKEVESRLTVCTGTNLRQDNGQVQKKSMSGTMGSFTQNMILKSDINHLKETGESFVQDGKCFEVAPKLPRCRECSLSVTDSMKKAQVGSDSILCRFYAFRKLRYSSKGFLATAGFLDPHSDPTQTDLELWLPLPGITPPQMELKMAKYILRHVGSQFFDLCKQEAEAISMHISDEKTVAWKKPITGCREMCDVCNTTLFNFHWTCRTCGFAVCIDCYKARKSTKPLWMNVDRPWLICVNKRPHDQEKLMLTQIVAADSIKQLSNKVNGIMSSLGLFLDRLGHLSSDTAMSNVCQPASNEGSTTNTEDYLTKFYGSLKEKLRQTRAENSKPDVVLCMDELNEIPKEVRRLDTDKAAVVPRVMTHAMSSLLYPDCPHNWLCEGRLLLLSDPAHVQNYPIFQDQWKRGQPVLVSGVLKFLNEKLWQPDSFIRDFGEKKNDLVNCMTGQIIPGQYMRTFWEGFQEVCKMLKDEKKEPMLLKLKDWPPGEDFAEMLPSRFEDLMKALPMGEYTKRTGQLNLPSRLPDCFARPDLGPKMYIAYGSAIHPTKGTTNLHLDMSDAVNVMVYVGIPKDINKEEYIEEAYRAVDEACSEMQMRRRVREEMPGALWHIYSARDANKIRGFLSTVARERKIKLGCNQDPIHDQSWYLDTALRDRLYREYQVKGYAVVQCLGDAVFIPAGAPHQVRNLLNCIKVAEDFVSPENVFHCLHLTQEFRRLSELHTNHEDKLQIKNIIYHAVKDAVSVLSQYGDNTTPISY